MKELLVSPPGTGKTSHCIGLFKRNVLKSKSGIDSRSFFVLPSHEHADRIRHLILKKDLKGLFNAQLLTIGELAARFLGAAAGAHPNDALRRSLVRDILEAHALPYFHELRQARGFCELLVDAIKEFKAGLLTMREFESRAQKLLRDPVFRMKFRDFSVVFKNYEKRLEALGLGEPEDDILSLTSPKKSVFSAELVIFDGFYHFTRAQSEFIRVVSKNAAHTVVTLTMPVDAKNREGVFDYPARTRAMLLANGFRENRAGFKTNHRTSEPALKHLADHIFSAKSVVYKPSTQALRFIEAPTLRAEVEAIAREIRRLYRETPVHYSDVCVILRSVAGYQKEIEAVFGEFAVPVTVHERKKLAEHAAGKTVYRLLCLWLDGWKKEDLFYLLKSSLLASADTAHGAAALEALSFRANLEAGRERWRELLAPLPGSDACRKLFQDLEAWETGFLASGSAGELAGALKRLLTPWKANWERDSWDEKAFGCLEQCLKNLKFFYEGKARGLFSPAHFMSELRGRVEAALFSVKPVEKNCVQVYDVVMAMPKEYKVVFMPGLLEKVFPQNVFEDALFKDHERRVLNQKGVVLEERRWRKSGERYFFYMGLSRAGQRLILSRPLTDEEERPALGSFFLNEVERCFLPETWRRCSTRVGFLPGPGQWESEREVTRGLADEMFRRRLSPAPAPFLDDWLHRPDFQSVLRDRLAGQEARIRGEAGRKHFRSLSGPYSPTRLETYGTCAFKYFCERVLELSDPFESREAMETGLLLHRVLETYFKELSPEQRQNARYLKDPDKMKEALAALLHKLWDKNKFASLPPYRQRLIEASMEEALGGFVDHEVELSRRRDFVPTHFELKFRDLKLAAGSKEPVEINGQIDRVDVNGKGQAVIVDYKLSKRQWSIHQRLEKGLEFQLPLYVLAVKELLNLDVLGAELRLLKDKDTQGLYREDAKELLGTGRRLTYDAASFDQILDETKSRTRELVKRLRDADIDIRSKTCQYCRFDSVCRFEKWKLDYDETV